MGVDPMTGLPDRLRTARERAGLSLRELEVRSGIHYQSLHRYEAGLVEPSAGKVALLARALGVSADWLLGLRKAIR